MNDISKTVGGFRSAIQDLLVPELKAIQTELKHHSEEFARIDKHFEAIDKRFEAVDKRFEDLRREMNQRFEAVFESLHRMELAQGEILAKLDVKQEVIEYTSKTNALEKRMDDLWVLLKSSKFFSPT
jgi:predicted  nucleic acid-binding Zn-ribbon protein